MTFKELIDNVITDSDFHTAYPINADKSLEFIKHIITNPTQDTVIVGDWDVDGIHSAKIVYDDLVNFGLPKSKLHVYFGQEKTHGIDVDFQRYCLKAQIHNIIIVDSSSNALTNLKYLKEFGYNIMVIDHHIPDYSYGDYKGLCTIVNTKLPGNDVLYEVSAGFLCAILSKYWRESLGYKESLVNWVYGYITLHSDGCLLYDDFIKPLVMHPERFKNNFPKEIKPFTTQWTNLNREFVSFSYCPKINNICRHNREDLLQKLFFEDISDAQRQKVVQEATDLYVYTKSELSNINSHFKEFVEDRHGIYFADIDKASRFTTLNHEFLVNSTGLIANGVSSKVQAPVIAFIDTQDTYIKMSGRDTTNTIDFKKLLEAYNLDGGGHTFAVGFRISMIDFNIFRKQLNSYTTQSTTPQYFTWDCTNSTPMALKDILYDVACYNEVATGKLKPIYLQIYLDMRYEQQQRGKLRTFSYAGLTIKDLKSETSLNSKIIVKPNISKMNELIVVYDF